MEILEYGSLVINDQHSDVVEHDIRVFKTRLIKQCEVGRVSNVLRLLQLGANPDIATANILMKMEK